MPKFRRCVFSLDALAKNIENTIREIASQYNMTIHALKVMPDHVHVFVGLHPSMSVSDMFQKLKGISSFAFSKDFPWYKQKFRMPCLWSKGKFFRSVGSVTAEAVKHYIENSTRNQRLA